MSQIPEENLSPRWAEDTRPEIPVAGDERSTLTASLEWHRQTLEMKCSGVDPARLSERGIPPSTMSLHGILRHLAAVERWWFQIRYREDDVELLYYSDDDPGQDFDSLGGDVAEVFDVWHAECGRSREIVATTASLEVTGGLSRSGEPISLRWVLVQMIAEYARHNGHADLLRERIDGATGF
ncbi:MAG: DinB family protein [Nocardioidaceae bacterium]